MVFLLMLAGILYYRPTVFSYISLLVSVVVMLLQAKVNRYAFLQIATNGIMLVTFLLMLKTDPSRIIWAINSANAVISSCLALKNMKKERKQTMAGKIICDLAPCAANERNSEGAFLPLKDGSLLFAYTRYRNGGWDDHCTADLYGIRSTDGGESFGEPFLLLSCEEVGRIM